MTPPNFPNAFLSTFWDFEGMNGFGINKTNRTCHERGWGLFLNRSDKCPRVECSDERQVEWLFSDMSDTHTTRHKATRRVVTTATECLLCPPAQGLPWKQDSGLSISEPSPVPRTEGLHGMPPAPLLVLVAGQEQHPWVELFHHNWQPQASSQRIIRDHMAC